MPTVALEGTGASIHFTDSNISGYMIALTIDDQTREAIDTTHLGTVGSKTSKPGKTRSYRRVVAKFHHKPDDDILTDAPVQVVRIDYPAIDGEVTSIYFYAAATKQGGEQMALDVGMVTEIELMTFVDDDLTKPSASLSVESINVNMRTAAIDGSVVAFGSHVISLSWGDGSPDVISPEFPLSHTFPSNIPYTVTLTVVQSDEQTATAELIVDMTSPFSGNVWLISILDGYTLNTHAMPQIQTYPSWTHSP